MNLTRIKQLFDNITIETLILKYKNELYQDLQLLYIDDYKSDISYNIDDKVIYGTLYTPDKCYKCKTNNTIDILPSVVDTWDIDTDNFEKILTNFFLNNKKNLINIKSLPLLADENIMKTIIEYYWLHFIYLDKLLHGSGNAMQQISSQSAHGLSISYNTPDIGQQLNTTKYGIQLLQLLKPYHIRYFIGG